MKRLTIALALIAAASSLCHAEQTQGRKDIMDRAFITPTRIVWTKGDVSGQEELLKPGNGQSDMAGSPCCDLAWTPDTTSIILDYGKELHGGLKMVMNSSERYPKLVRIRFGESVAETCSEVCDTDWIARHSTDDHAMRDYTIKVPRDGSIEIGNTGFRFVRIDLLEPGTTLALREATAILRWRDIPWQGSFSCSDERLNAIWETGAWTTHLNMQEYIWDGIKRDRLIWLGDMHPEMSTVCAVFGYNDVIDRSIDLACQQYPIPQWLNGMSAYSMWYLIIQYDWYMQNGDIDFIRKHRDYIKGVIDTMDGRIHEDGSEDLAASRFLDWPSSPNEDGVEAGYRALLTIALEKGAKLCELIGEPESAAKALAARERLSKTVKPHNDLKQAAALMALAGLMPAQQACEEVVESMVPRASRPSTATTCSRRLPWQANTRLQSTSYASSGAACSTWAPPPSGRTSTSTGRRTHSASTRCRFPARTTYTATSATTATGASATASATAGHQAPLPGSLTMCWASRCSNPAAAESA